jgi:protein-S-isoprenylcysteine O-methyltransferase Ste14
MILRHFAAIALLPFVMTVVVPLWVARNTGATFALGADLPAELLQLAGVLSLALGLSLFVASLRRFATEGEGTLAPWDPPRHLVVRGPYRYVRNPMISGVIFILLGEAGVLRSGAHLTWALLFLAGNAVHFPLVEEPLLARKFGAEYDEYRRHVRRFIPRLRPWTPPANSQTS